MVGHLDELRTRIIVSLIALAVAFGVCFWQNHRLLTLIDSPLAHQTQQQVRDGQGPLGATYQVQQSARDVATQLRTVAGVLRGRASRHAGGRGPAEPGAAQSQRRHRAALGAAAGRPAGDARDRRAVHDDASRSRLIFALILALPLLLWQVYGFFMPALEPEQRRHVRSLALAIPGLFVAGVAFGYFVVLPAAVHFFQNFNADQFNVLVQASQYYKFAATTLLAMGLLFQVPVAILAITRAGVITPAPAAPQPPLRGRGLRRWSLRCCRATRSRCCSRRCRCICCSRSASCSPRSRSAAREGSRPRPRHPPAPDPIAARLRSN